jgi:macrodomain Ter protein organizer (MatP/YcbG family)
MFPEPTDEELQRWWGFAQKVAKSKKFDRDYLSLGPDHYASEAIEKLLSQEHRPDNVEAWLRTVIINAFKNHDKRNVFEEGSRWPHDQ